MTLQFNTPNPDNGVASTADDAQSGGIVLRLAHKYTTERLARGEINEKTARSTKQVLGRFAAATGYRDPKKLQRRHVEKWLEGLDVRPGTRYRDWSVLRCFTRWCVLNGHMRTDPTVGVTPPKVPRSAPRKLNTVDATKVARHAPDARGRVMVLLMLQECLRCAEVAAIEFGDVDTIELTLAVRGKGGAGQVTRHVAISGETAAAISYYLAEHPAGAGPLIRSYLRPTRGITAHYVTQMVGQWMKDAGVKGQAWDGKSAHALRHTGASNMAEGGADVLAISRVLGHSNLNTTQIYLSGVTPDMRRAMGGRTYMDDPTV